MRITVQLRRLQSTAREGRKTPPQSGTSTPRAPLPEASDRSFYEGRPAMSLDSLRKAMANHGVHADAPGPASLTSTGSGFTRFSQPAHQP